MTISDNYVRSQGISDLGYVCFTRRIPRLYDGVKILKKMAYFNFQNRKAAGSKRV